MKKCSSCTVEYPLVNFNKGQTYCKPCAKRLKAMRTNANKRFAQRFKLIKGCSCCGYNQHPEALCFSHLEKDTKWSNQKEYEGKNRSAVLYCWSRDRIKTEIRKCEVLCMNCHTVQTIKKGEHL